MLEQNRSQSQSIAGTNQPVKSAESQENNESLPSWHLLDGSAALAPAPPTALKNPFRPPIPLALQDDFLPARQRKGSMMQKDLDVASEYLNEMRLIYRYLRAHKWELAGLGFLGVVVHFWRVGYLPQLSFMDIGLLATAMAAFTLLAVLFFVFVVLSPSLALIAWSNQQIICRPPMSATRLRASRRKQRICPCCNNPVCKSSKTGSPVQRITCLVFGFPLLGFFTALGLLWSISSLPEDWSTYALGLLLIICIGTFLASLIDSRPTTGAQRRERRRRRWVKYYIRCVALYGIVIPIAALTGSVLLRAFRDGDDLTKGFFWPPSLSYMALSTAFIVTNERTSTSYGFSSRCISSQPPELFSMQMTWRRQNSRLECCATRR